MKKSAPKDSASKKKLIKKALVRKEKTQKIQFGLGWIPDLPDIRDRAYAAPMGVLQALPPKVDLRPKCPPITNQGTLGSCTANAIGSAHFFNQILQNSKKAFQPSRLFLYYNERRMEGNIECDSGAIIRDGFKSIAKEGVCPETLWEYHIPSFTTEPPSSAYQDALNHQVLQYMRVQQSLGQMKGCLADGYPFVFGFTVYESFKTPEVAKTGIMHFPTANDSMIGGHAIMAVGYDDEKQHFIIQNSWGTEWGDKGFFYMPYSYATDSNLAADFWTIRLVEI